MRSKSEKEEFNKLLLESINEALNILGESTKKVLLYFLKQNYRTEEKEIIKDPELLIHGIRKFFGEVGSAFLESRIIETLYGKLGLTPPSALNFEDALKNARKLYLQT